MSLYCANAYEVPMECRTYSKYREYCRTDSTLADSYAGYYKWKYDIPQATSANACRILPIGEGKSIHLPVVGEICYSDFYDEESGDVFDYLIVSVAADGRSFEAVSLNPHCSDEPWLFQYHPKTGNFVGLLVSDGPDAIAKLDGDDLERFRAEWL